MNPNRDQTIKNHFCTSHLHHLSHHLHHRSLRGHQKLGPLPVGKPLPYLRLGGCHRGEVDYRGPPTSAIKTTRLLGPTETQRIHRCSGDHRWAGVIGTGPLGHPGDQPVEVLTEPGGHTGQITYAPAC